MRTLALDCVLQLLVWPGLTEAAQRPALCALLAAFHKEAPVQLEGEEQVLQCSRTSPSPTMMHFA